MKTSARAPMRRPTVLMRINVKITGDQGQARAKRANAPGRPCRLKCYPSFGTRLPIRRFSLERSYRHDIYLIIAMQVYQ